MSNIRTDFFMERGMSRNNIKRLRKHYGLSHTDLAHAVGLRHHSAISRYEGGVINIPIVVLCRIADVFGCSIDCLLGRERQATNGPVAGEEPPHGPSV